MATTANIGVGIVLKVDFGRDLVVHVVHVERGADHVDFIVSNITPHALLAIVALGGVDRAV